MLTIEPGRPMRQHATKMGRRTAFHAEAERVSESNRKALESIRLVYLANQQIAELAWQRRNSYSSKRKKFEADWSKLKFELIPDRANPPLGIWRRQCERDDIRAYGARCTGGLVDIANHKHGLWWYQLTEAQRFAIVWLSRPVIDDDTAQARREKSRGKFDAD